MEQRYFVQWYFGGFSPASDSNRLEAFHDFPVINILSINVEKVELHIIRVIAGCGWSMLTWSAGEARWGCFYCRRIRGANTWRSICQNFYIKLTLCKTAHFLTCLQAGLRSKIWRPPFKNLPQNFLRLSSFKWEEAARGHLLALLSTHRLYPFHIPFLWFFSFPLLFRISFSFPNFPASPLFLSYPPFVVFRPYVFFSLPLKQALIRQWWCRHFLAEVMFTHLVSLFQSLY